MHNGTLQLARRSLAAQCRPFRSLWSPAPQRRLSTSASPSPAPSSPIGARQWSTPLAKTIADAIEATGPISIAAYMRQCLTSPQGGYYTTPSGDVSSTTSTSSISTTATSDQFGKRGDFITSPEISQIFGELVGIWFVTEWLAQGRPTKGVQLIELGPGRGTLMADMLRTIAQFKGKGLALVDAIEGVWLVEAGDALREKQKRVLCGESAGMKEVNCPEWSGWECTSRYSDIPIRWVEDVTLLPKVGAKQNMPFIVAHEFFDALPIHAFESVAPAPETQQTELLNKDGMPLVRQSQVARTPQWRELLVTPTKRKLNLVGIGGANKNDAKADPDFQLTIAKASTPMSLLLPEQSPRYQKLKNQIGSRIEISPDSFRYAQDISRRIGGSGTTTSNPSVNSPSPPSQLDSTPSSTSSGAALLIDYGPLSTIPINSLRGIKSHTITSPFSSPGTCDISADVDFSALATAALSASPHIEIHGPITQGDWLSQLGIAERAAQLLSGVRDEQKRQEIESGWKRLVESGPRGMGKAYKVMAIVPEGGGRRKPVGFGGGVVS